MNKIRIACLVALASLALMLSSCASLGVSSKGADYFVGKKESALAKYFGYDGDVLAEDDEDFDKVVYFSNKYIAAYMDYSNTTRAKSRRYSDVSNFQFLQMSDGCYVGVNNSHYEQRYDPGSVSAGGVSGGEARSARSPEVYTIHRNDNGTINGWISQFNGNVRSYGAVGSEYNNSRFNAGNVGDRYYIYSITSDPVTLGGEAATRYRYRLQRVDIYMDVQTESDTQTAFHYSIPNDVYYASNRRTVISEDEAFGNVSGYESRGYALRTETSGLSVIAFIKDGVVDEIYEVSNEDSDLVFAAQCNSFGWVNEILVFGADPNVQDEYGDTALICAAGYGYENIVRLLLANGANPDIRGAGNWTALNAAASGDNTEIVRALLYARANPDIQNDDGTTALIWAAINDNAEIARLLLDAGANPNIRDNDGDTALDYAADAEIIRMLNAAR